MAQEMSLDTEAKTKRLYQIPFADDRTECFTSCRELQYVPHA